MSAPEAPRWHGKIGLRQATEAVMANVEQAMAERRAEWQAEALAEVENRIARAVPVNFELRYDGSEDKERAAYIGGLRTALSIVAELREEGR